jgi:hypothetical protein
MVSRALDYRGLTQTRIGRPHLEKLIVAWGLGQLLAVVDGLLERVELGGDHICGLMRCLVCGCLTVYVSLGWYCRKMDKQASGIDVLRRNLQQGSPCHPSQVIRSSFENRGDPWSCVLHD